MRRSFKDSIDDYFKLIDERPDEFINNGELSIITDYDELMNYCWNHSRELGLIYKSDYHLLVVDLVKDKSGNVFPYERLIDTTPGGAVIIPIYNDKYVLLKQYRHAMRDYQYAFPRGFAKLNELWKDTALRELHEELNCNSNDCKFVGKIIADSGVSGNKVNSCASVIVGDVSSVITEGIVDILVVTEQELLAMIARGEVNDGLTLSSLMLWIAQRDTL